MKNKRGISQVITTVLLILLAFAAIGILWFVVKPFLENTLGETDKTTQCLTYEPEILSAISSRLPGPDGITGTTDDTFQIIVKMRTFKKVDGVVNFYIGDEKISFTPTSSPEAGVIQTYTSSPMSNNRKDEAITTITTIGDSQCGPEVGAKITE